jgi:hypothetical protein
MNSGRIVALPLTSTGNGLSREREHQGTPQVHGEIEVPVPRTDYSDYSSIYSNIFIRNDTFLPCNLTK